MEAIKVHYDVPGDDFTRAGEASGMLKRYLKKIGFAPDVIRKVSIAMYEAEINMVSHAQGGEITVSITPEKMVIHAHGGEIDGEITPEKISVTLRDQGPGIPDVDLAMQEGYSTAPDNVRSLGFGAGMGLPNIKKYTDEMKIETVLGKGTTVYFSVNAQ